MKPPVETGTDPEDMLPEYDLDYSKAKPNRFASIRRSRELPQEIKPKLGPGSDPFGM